MDSLVIPATFTPDRPVTEDPSSVGAAKPTYATQDGSRSGSSLRGLMALRDIKPGDTVISVSLNLIVGYDYIMASDLGRVLARQVNKVKLTSAVEECKGGSNGYPKGA